jgi:hypothetical protein
LQPSANSWPHPRPNADELDFKSGSEDLDTGGARPLTATYDSSLRSGTQASHWEDPPYSNSLELAKSNEK